MMDILPILSIMTYFLGAFINSLFGRRSGALGKFIVFVATLIPLLAVFRMIPEVFFAGHVIKYWMGGWAPEGGWAFGIGLQVDALSLFFAVIITLAVFISGIYSFTYMSRDDSQVNFYTLFLMLSGSVLGLVMSGDLFNVYVMVEIMTFTAVALTAFRNNYEGALEGAFKYLVVGSVGSTSILIGTILTYARLHTLNMAQIASFMPENLDTVLVIAFAFLVTGFATKAFLFPFQPLAADAHAVAPASISLMISGVLTKCGVYGLVRISYDLFRNIYRLPVEYLITGLGVVTMFICVTMAFNQHNFKRLLAFHSISQVGYVITAIGIGTPLGLTAGLFHAINHTVFKGLLFLTAGAVQHETGSLDLDGLGGLSKRMPKTCMLFLIGAASISGLPPFNGFASKWMIYQALFQKAGQSGNAFFVLALIMALVTSVLTLASFVKVFHSVFFGQMPEKYRDTKEVPTAMIIPMGILAVICILLGVLYMPFTRFFTLRAAQAAMDTGTYIQSMFQDNYFYGMINISFSGVWNPVIWLILLLIVSLAVMIFSVRNRERSAEKDMIKVTALSDRGLINEERVLPEESKYEPFFSGEESNYSMLGGSDLFWGFKENWKKYFSFWHDFHSGIVSDYALYAAAALSFILLYCLIFV